MYPKQPDPVIGKLITSRLIGTPMGPADRPDLRRLHADPTAMATLSVDGRPLAPDAAPAACVRMAEHWHQYGIGVWSFRWPDTHRLGGHWVGYAGLIRRPIPQPDGSTPQAWELMYGVLPEYWNQGLGSEMAAATLTHGRHDHGIRRVACFTLYSNVASRRLMRRLGFIERAGIVSSGLPHVLAWLD